MQIGSIGPGSTAAFQAWADMISANGNGTNGLEKLAAGLGASAGTALAQGSSVNLSDGALGLAASDATGGDATLGELTQALMVALILQLLDPKGGSQ